MRASRIILAFALAASSIGAAATELAVVGTKLVVIDKIASSGRAKVVFTAKDQSATKGVGTDPTQIEATLYVAYDGGGGAFAMPQGSNWQSNDPGGARYVNAAAPGGGSVKLGVVQAGKYVKAYAKSLGDVPLDVSMPPAGAVYLAYSITNGGETTVHCTQFAQCTHRSIAEGTGIKLVCPGNSGSYRHSGPAACVAATPACLVDRFVDNGSTVLDNCTNLEWEKKDRDATPGNLHFVQRSYVWAGRCSISTALCQPNGAAAATCAAQTGGADGCSECGAGEGTCENDFNTTTVWDWINQVNAENFAGHSDWRLPTATGSYGLPSGDALELESILDMSRVVCGNLTGCLLDPAFGPTGPSDHWTASSAPGAPYAGGVWVVNFGGFAQTLTSRKDISGAVRAVR